MLDKLERLWAPWRGAYVTSHRDGDCVFCAKPLESQDRSSYILYRGQKIYVIMNLYPYNNGHLMLVPYRHTADLADLSEAESTEMSFLTKMSLIILKEKMRAQGFNVGYNLGSAAGAGIAGHIHQHIVPRWEGDTNFMPVIAETKVISEHMDATYDKLRDGFKKISGGDL